VNQRRHNPPIRRAVETHEHPPSPPRVCGLSNLWRVLYDSTAPRVWLGYKYRMGGLYRR